MRNSARAPARLTLYGRSGCHLCEAMAADLVPLQEEFGFALSVVDLEQHPELEPRYGERIPVLEAAGRELCRYRLDPAAVRARLSGFR